MSGNQFTSVQKMQEGLRLYKIKRYDLALKEFLKIDTADFDDRDNIELAYHLGLCYTKLNRFDDALLYLEQVVTNEDDVLRIHQCRLMLAYIYVITKRIKMAEFELKRLQINGFESVMLYNFLGFTAWMQKNYRHSVELYEKALALDDENATVINSLGYILTDTDIDIMRGLRLCKKAVDKKPNNAAYLDSLGWSYFKNGELIEARTWLRRALDLAPNDKDIKEHFRIVTGGAV